MSQRFECFKSTLDELNFPKEIILSLFTEECLIDNNKFLMIIYDCCGGISFYKRNKKLEDYDDCSTCVVKNNLKKRIEVGTMINSNFKKLCS